MLFYDTNNSLNNKPARCAEGDSDERQPHWEDAIFLLTLTVCYVGKGQTASNSAD
ncbi:hypothetical protein BH23GEM3_BH23GEM3_26610 [soil metagenome]